MTNKRLEDMTLVELEEAINGAERVLTALRAEIKRRPGQGLCGNHWGKFTCNKANGHEGMHGQGFITWPRR